MRTYLKMIFLEKYLLVCAVLVGLKAANPEEDPKLIRDKRTALLLYGPFSVIQLIIGFGTPIPDYLSPSVTLGFFWRGVYAVPKNASEYLRPNISELTRSLPISRWDIYQVLEKDSEIRGYGGRACVLKAICQAAETPIDKYHGFFEEVFHTIFTPSSTNEVIRDHSDNDYLAAHHLGKFNPGVCGHAYPECRVTFLDLFTQLFTSFVND